MRLLVIGGAGFVGSSLCRAFKAEDSQNQVVAVDNLKRRGSEYNVADFRRLGIEFVHGDVRCPTDLTDLAGNFDLVIEASAEPSVHAGTQQGTSCRYLMDTNLVGTLNALEFARTRCGGMIFLSTSRVYSISRLRELPLYEDATRLSLPREFDGHGASGNGIAEDFPTVGHGFRSLYGTTKLASELFIEEYGANFKLPVLVNRCGVLAGPGQFGKTDQGVFTLWVARHVFGGTLSYTGFGGTGKQVRDILHPQDLYELIALQLPALHRSFGDIYAVGGGLKGAVSLREYTTLCEKASGNRLSIGSVEESAAVDIPYYVTDTTRVRKAFGWQPKREPASIVADIYGWLTSRRDDLKDLFR